MNGKKSLWKRVFSCFLSVALMATVLPVPAFALTDDTKLTISRAYVDNEGIYQTDINATSEEAKKLQFNHEVGNKWKLDNNSIDTYVYSTDMSETERNGSVVPYFFDEARCSWRTGRPTERHSWACSRCAG